MGVTGAAAVGAAAYYAYKKWWDTEDGPSEEEQAAEDTAAATKKAADDSNGPRKPWEQGGKPSEMVPETTERELLREMKAPASTPADTTPTHRRHYVRK